MGTPAFAAASLKALVASGHDIVGVVTRPDAAAGRGLARHASAVKQEALSHGMTLLQPRRIKDPDLHERIRGLSPDVTVVAAFGRILPLALLEAAPLGAVNVHASLLPRWRGAAPIAWAIACGDERTGVSIMRMVERLDAGDVLASRATPIGPEETTGRLEARLADLGATLLVETLGRIATGSIEATPQAESAATYAPMLTKEDGRIDWSLPAPTIERRVRAFDPWPVAWTVTPREDRLRLWRVAVAASGMPGSDPGTLTVLPRGAGGEPEDAGPVVRVTCGDGTALTLLDVQPEGRRRMTAREAVSGRHLKTGDRLGGA